MYSLTRFRKRLIPKGLVSRIVLIFVVFALLLSSIQYLALTRLWISSVQQLRQRLEWTVASDLASLLQPLLEDSNQQEALRRRIAEVSLINPRIEVFIVDAKGKIIESRAEKDVLAFYYTPPKAIIATLEGALRPEVNRSFPIFIELPGTKQRNSPFSVARIRYHGQPAYLLVILESSKYERLFRALETYHLLIGSSIVCLALFLGISAVGYMLIQRITRRFQNFSGAVHKLAAGELATRIEVIGDDEISVLGNSINEMAARLERSIAALNANDRWRREMVAAISHDLKSPLASLRAHVEQLSSSRYIVDNNELARQVGIVSKNIQVMSTQLDDLLELSRLESGQVVPELIPFNLAEIVQGDILPRFQLLAQRKGLSLSLNAAEPKEQCIVFADLSLIDRAISNLIANSINYTEFGSVEIRLEQEIDTLRIKVIDTGVGIPEHAVEEMIQPFNRGDSARSMKLAGTGLGLAIVNLIVKAHGSALLITPNQPQGTIIEFVLYRDKALALKQLQPLGATMYDRKQ